jgi:DNA-directed RNA polymerase specialized sigma24 family protein
MEGGFLNRGRRAAPQQQRQQQSQPQPQQPQRPGAKAWQALVRAFDAARTATEQPTSYSAADSRAADRAAADAMRGAVRALLVVVERDGLIPHSLEDASGGEPAVNAWLRANAPHHWFRSNDMLRAFLFSLAWRAAIGARAGPVRSARTCLPCSLGNPAAGTTAASPRSQPRHLRPVRQMQSGAGPTCANPHESLTVTRPASPTRPPLAAGYVEALDELNTLQVMGASRPGRVWASLRTGDVPMLDALYG